MLTLNRNRQSLLAPALMVAAASFLGWATHSATAAIAVQDSDRSRTEPSILVRDDVRTDQLSQDNLAPRVRPSFTARPQEQSAQQPRPTQPAFEIPANPTREDFTNPSTEGFDLPAGAGQYSTARQSDVDDRLAATGTFTREAPSNDDRFAAPQPPLGSLRSSGSMSAPVRVADPAAMSQRSERKPRLSPPSPIGQNDLRGGATSSAIRVSPSGFAESGRPKVDAATAEPRFVDTRPAPPATMPNSADNYPTERFNPQFFGRRANANTTTPSTQTPDRRSTRPVAQVTDAHPAHHEPTHHGTTNLQPIDDQIAATSYSQPVAAEPVSPSKLAKTIVDRYSMDNAPDPLPGEPMSLVEMLRQPLPPQYRRQMISQYWETWFDWASTQNAIACQEWLKTIPQSAAGDKGLLDAAQSAADNEVLAAEIQLGKSQSKLIRFMPTRGSDLAPLPSDSPLVERYETHYQVYKSRNLLPANLQGIDQMLPRTLELIESRAQTVQKAQAAIKQTLSAYKNRQAPLASVLEAARVWRASEEDLLASVTNYNQAIADYALSVTKRYTTPEQTVAMLIGTPQVKTEALPTAARTARQPSFGNNQNGITQNGTRRSATGVSFGQTGQAPRQSTGSRSAVADFGGSARNRPSQPTTQSSWNGGSNTVGRRTPATTSTKTGRPQADSRPSLNTTARGSTGSRSNGANNSNGGSATAFGALSPPPANKTIGSSSNPSSQRKNNLFGGSGNTSPVTKPARKPFPLPKRPKSTDNSFGGFRN